MNITKEIFIKTIGEIEKQYVHDRKCSDAFKIVFHNDFISGYDNSFLQVSLVELLKILTDDNHKDSWIDYFIYELDFGDSWEEDSVTENGKSIKLKNSKDLWKLLCTNKKT